MTIGELSPPRPVRRRGGMTVEQRTSRGALQAIGVTALTAPAGLLILVILGRVSPEALGFYALMTLLVGLFAGLLTLGGPAVATRAAADVGGHPNRATYIQTFAAPVFAAAGAGALGFLPPLRDQVSPASLAIVAAAVAMWTAAQGSTTATLRFGATSVIQNVPTLIQFAVLAVVALFAPGLLRAHANGIVVWMYALPTGLVGAVFAAALIRRGDIRQALQRVPSGLFRLTLGMELIVALTFLFEAGERIAALGAPDALATLGKYYAGVQVAYLVRRIPAIVGQASLPGFASLRGTTRATALHHATARRLDVVSFGLASALVMGGPLVAVLLGNRYAGTADVIAVIAIACAATAAWPLDTSYATAVGRLRLYQTSLLAGSLVFIPLFFTQRLFVLAACRAAALLVAQVVVVRGLRHLGGQRLRLMALALALGLGEFGLRKRFGLALAPLVWVIGLSAYILVSRMLAEHHGAPRRRCERL